VFFGSLCDLCISLVCLIRFLVDFIGVNTQLWEMSGHKRCKDNVFDTLHTRKSCYLINFHILFNEYLPIPVILLCYVCCLCVHFFLSNCKKDVWRRWSLAWSSPEPKCLVDRLLVMQCLQYHGTQNIHESYCLRCYSSCCNACSCHIPFIQVWQWYEFLEQPLFNPNFVE
jgi:hypothetical protein